MNNLERVFDNTLCQQSKYLIFWDKSGILENGLWVLLKPSDKCEMKVLPDPEFGDIMLCVEDNGADIEQYPQNITGFAMVVSKEPKDIVEYLRKYCSRIYSNLSKISGERRKIYEYLLGKLEGCNILCAKGLTMQRTGPTKQCSG
jgi:hypothetical protein